MFSVLIAFALATSQNSSEFGRNGRWLITKNEATCSMVTGFDAPRGGKLTILNVSVNDRLSTVTLTFSEPTTRSLKLDDTRSIEMRFLKTGVLDTGWGSSDFVVTATGDDGTFFSKRFTNEVLDDLAESRGVLFYYDDALLQAYPLDESANAVAKLRQCASDLSKSAPSDPFAD